MLISKDQEVGKDDNRDDLGRYDVKLRSAKNFDSRPPSDKSAPVANEDAYSRAPRNDSLSQSPAKVIARKDESVPRPLWAASRKAILGRLFYDIYDFALRAAEDWTLTE